MVLIELSKVVQLPPLFFIFLLIVVFNQFYQVKMPTISGEHDSNGTGKARYYPVANHKDLLPILEERLPISCTIYNQVVFGEKFGSDMRFYTLSPEINSSSWIVSNNLRKDYTQNIGISAPAAVLEGTQPIPDDVKECFMSDEVIQWDKEIGFCSLPRPISMMIADISTRTKGNVTELHPCYLYYMDKQDALKLPVNPGPGVEVRRLDPEDSKFIFETWLYKKESTKEVIPTWIKNTASAGVYVDGKCVSGVVTVPNGLVSALFTLKEHRKKGYARLTMNYVFKENALDGCVPCSTAEVRDGPSCGFHESLGVKPACIVDWIWLQHIKH